MRVAEEVADALADGCPVVALESTIFSGLGLPDPAGRECLARCDGAVRAAGAVPAITSVLDGEPAIGVVDERVFSCTAKVAERDLMVAVGQRWPVGVTTVSASLRLAASTGIAVFATGGIGGVHRDSHVTGDVSADLLAISAHGVLTVCAGAKAFLDLPRTLEHLETSGVPVLVLGADEFPAFTTRSSGLPSPRRIERVAEAAAIFRARDDIGYGGGVLVAVPVPAADEVPKAELDAAIDRASAAAAAAGVSGAALTPFVLAAIADATEGRSVPANLALAEQNASVAGQIAVLLAAGRG